MSTIDTFAEDLHGYLAPEQVAQVVRAYDFAEEFFRKIVSANNLGDLLWSEVPVKVFSKGVYG